VGERGPREVYRRVLADIVQPRVEEIFMMIKRDLEVSGYKEQMAAGLVLSGGASIMEGMPEIAEAIFNMPVRRGSPRNVGGIVDLVKSPEYSAVVGLAHIAAKDYKTGAKRPARGRSSFGNGLGKVWGWLKDFF
jgi:cell division protein FtsA